MQTSIAEAGPPVTAPVPNDCCQGRRPVHLAPARRRHRGGSRSRDNPRVSLRAAGIEAFGDDVALLNLPEPPLWETGRVLIEVRAAGVGIGEDLVRRGGGDAGRAPPLALGVEAAGEVVGVGPEVEWP